MPGQNEDFTEIIEKAQRVNNDMGSLFGSANMPGRVAFEPEPNRAGPEHDWDAHVEVYNLPTDKEGYEDVLNQSLHGEAVIRYEERTFTKEGDFLVAVCYMTKRQRAQPEGDQDAGDAEALVRPHRLP